MSVRLELMLALRYLQAKNKYWCCSMVTMLSVLGIALGVTALIVVMSVMHGFSTQLRNSILGMNGHITVYCDSSDYCDVAQAIKSIEGVTAAIPVTENQAMIQSQNNVLGVVVRGIDQQEIVNKKILFDSIIDGNIDEFNQGVILGARLAENLKVKCGDNVTIISPEGFITILGSIPRVKTYKVVGLFDMGMYEYDSTFVYMPVKFSQILFKYGNKIKYIEVFLKDADKSSEILKSIQNKVNYKLEDWKIQQGQYFHALQIESNVMFLILTLIIVVAAFNIISSISVLVQDKKQAIAIMRTMGASKWCIMRIFCICGILIGGIGTGIGCIAGIGFSLHINEIKSFLENITSSTIFDPIVYFLDSIPSKLLVEDVVYVAMLAIGIAFVMTIPPALKAAYQDPVDILKYE
ncbi:lipoprotein-releasing ABC transporter permease subunit [Neoehrlichia mikurensis]|uniref:Lipoprotein-releasing ABC transporter permease subunit n=1 Tax=Neoehrlichia mikurensis TaxID=89586 RepID=A0A9Q9F4C7_9RICK|nr:lipoprotein-releasing ABC transporter permease subunit [Neoehrlichia mikurensis]QXK92265.1 lipoprotein-releasing ABC transporter permease subunit [Neoehrlichia mikurensis]QXK92719.1 lipoprotein-releasing ABC transporter permease subunit [Neoehrlichia mikurensis]QXK93958.1 lipoprotein-releasing ABC transporter permease subunit [Neoehrlichia mikurensis]UTO55877.1 lipoprotein-releasing ABC transporter permease subunit [Neoehrlichia mikurensis]UTO56793.1 lipoprotein-releasing ABC transporter pe